MRKHLAGLFAIVGLLLVAVIFMAAKPSQPDAFTDYCVHHAHAQSVSEGCDHCVIDGGTAKRGCYCYWDTVAECWRCTTLLNGCN